MHSDRRGVHEVDLVLALQCAVLAVEAIERLDEFLFALILTVILCAIPKVRQVLDDATLTGTLILMRVSIGQIEARPQRRDLVLCDVGLDGTLQTLGALRSAGHM